MAKQIQHIDIFKAQLLALFIPKIGEQEANILYTKLAILGEHDLKQAYEALAEILTFMEYNLSEVATLIIGPEDNAN